MRGIERPAERREDRLLADEFAQTPGPEPARQDLVVLRVARALGHRGAALKGIDQQATPTQGTACLWLLRSRPDQVRTAPLPGTR